MVIERCRKIGVPHCGCAEGKVFHPPLFACNSTDLKTQFALGMTLSLNWK